MYIYIYTCIGVDPDFHSFKVRLPDLEVELETVEWQYVFTYIGIYICIYTYIYIYTYTHIYTYIDR